MVTVPAMLPIYTRLGMDPLVLTCTTALAAGTMNILPWGGPATRAATTLQVGVGEVFAPLAIRDGGRHGRRCSRSPRSSDTRAAPSDGCTCRGRSASEVQEHRRRRRSAAGCRGCFWFNAALTVATLAALVVGDPAAAGRLPDRVRHGARRQLPESHTAARAADGARQRRDGDGHDRARRRPLRRNHDEAPGC